MDASAERRGRPSAHVQFAQWHRERGLSGSSRRFGESSAILLGDLCLIWASQMMRESGVEPARLLAVWPRYDEMRTELAVGQFADLAGDIRKPPSLETVLDVARRKSGNYTVRRPLEIGAAMADCDDRTLAQLGRYGAAIGEAFQLRDDVLGVFGSPATTGKPSGGDLLEHKATSVVVTAHQLADATTRRELTALMNSDDLDDAAARPVESVDVRHRGVQMIEEMISDRFASAREQVGDMAIDETRRARWTAWRPPARTGPYNHMTTNEDREHVEHADRRGTKRPRGGGRCRPGGPVRRAAPGRSGAHGHGGRALPVAGRTGRPARRRRLPDRHRSDGADDAGHHRRRLSRPSGRTGPAAWSCCRSIRPTARCSPTAARSTCTPTRIG